MPLYPHGTGIKPNAALPTPYTFKLSASTGRLELWKNGKLIQAQDETGSWITMGVSTGTGSLHIGDLHSNGSGGENVVWVNEDSAVAYFPSWAGVAKDGSSAFSATVREHGALTTAEPNGAVAAGTSVDYLATFTAPADVAFFYIDIVPAETFTGRVLWKAEKSTGKEVASFFLDVVAVAGSALKIPFKYPLWAKSGQTFTVSIQKDGGAYLKVRGGATAPTIPYRKTYTRTFTDYNVHHTGNPAAIARNLETLTGSDQLSPQALRSLTATRAIVTDANGKPAVSSVTSTELGVLSGTSSKTSPIIVDSDAFVINDGGVMKQVGADAVQAYARYGFANGAVGNALTQKLTFDRVVVTDSNGQLAAGNPYVSELNAFVGQEANTSIVRQSTPFYLNLFGYSIRGLTIRLQIYSTYTAVQCTCDIGGMVRWVIRYSHQGLNPTSSCSAVDSGTNYLTCDMAVGRGWTADGFIYSTSDRNRYIRFRLYMVDETSTIQNINCQMW